MSIDNLRTLRLLQGRSQAEISKYTRIDPATYSRIEAGILRGTEEQRRRISAALGVSVDDISWPKDK